jgi:hypothetical protein
VKLYKGTLCCSSKAMNLRDHWCFVRVCSIQVTVCVTPDTLTRFGARAFSINFTSSCIRHPIAVREVHDRGVWACRECHTFVTWMEQT